tara:strand:+ start:180 stop:509 length:330 start_codon:yes stop_codon:yes gene_type:complete
MNDLTVFIYLVFFVALFGATFAFMFKSMTDIQREMDRSPTRSYADAMRAYTPKKIVTRMTHPELDRVDEYDDEGLMKSLDARIQEIEEDDEDDEGDGDVPAKPYVGSGI